MFDRRHGNARFRWGLPSSFSPPPIPLLGSLPLAPHLISNYQTSGFSIRLTFLVSLFIPHSKAMRRQLAWPKYFKKSSDINESTQEIRGPGWQDIMPSPEATTGANTNSTRPKKKKACRRCRHRKQRCDFEQPCQNCLAAGQGNIKIPYMRLCSTLLMLNP